MTPLEYILIILVVILGFTTFNLLRKNEKAEDIILYYKDYMEKISYIIESSDKKLKEIDEKGIFKSDDEIGWFFKNIQSLQELLNQFKLSK